MNSATKTQVVKFIRKGEKGKDAHSPYVGDNGNWFVYDDSAGQYVDSGRSATGDDGHSPYVGDNGNWFEYNAETGKYEDTGIVAKGEKGDDGKSPVVEVTRNGNYVTIKTTNADGSVTTKNVYDGNDGSPGGPGADGQTTYFHVKYSDDGGVTFTANGGETPGSWIGQCTDTTKADPTTVGSYTWAKIKGETGAKGDTGNGIVSIVYYYAKTSTSSTPAASAVTGTTMPTLDATNRYLWQKEVITYTDGTSKTTVVLAAVYGDTGKTGDTGSRGPTMRGPQKWDSAAVGYSFQSGAAGESYKDVVVYNDNYYYCKSSHTKTASNYPGSTAGYYLWQLGDKVGLIATDLLIAKDEVVDNLNANYIEMKDSAGAIIFQAKDGEVTCNKGTFKNIEVDTATLKDVNVTGTIHHSSATSGVYSDADLFYLPAISSNVTISMGYDEDDIGKRCLLTNSSPTTSTAFYRVQPSKFGWNASGKQYKDLTVDSAYLIAPGETIEMTCFALPSGATVGNGTVTKGGYWKLTNRYSGYSLQPIVAMGIVTNSTSSTTATISAQSIFGTSGFTATRTGTGSGDGIYTITFPAPFASLKTPLVQITGIGYRQGETSTGPVKGTFISWTRSTRKMVVAVSDDDTANGGSFSFVVYSFGGWNFGS